jgi:hypothetical protein
MGLRGRRQRHKRGCNTSLAQILLTKCVIDVSWLRCAMGRVGLDVGHRIEDQPGAGPIAGPRLRGAAGQRIPSSSVTSSARGHRGTFAFPLLVRWMDQAGLAWQGVHRSDSTSPVKKTTTEHTEGTEKGLSGAAPPASVSTRLPTEALAKAGALRGHGLLFLRRWTRGSSLGFAVGGGMSRQRVARPKLSMTAPRPDKRSRRPGPSAAIVPLTSCVWLKVIKSAIPRRPASRGTGAQVLAGTEVFAVARWSECPRHPRAGGRDGDRRARAIAFGAARRGGPAWPPWR